MTENETPTPRPNTEQPATGQHGPSCPDRQDGDGGTRPCTNWDHDKKLWAEN